MQQLELTEMLFLNCVGCGSMYDASDLEYISAVEDGWWCETCECFNYWNLSKAPMFKVFLETSRPVNITAPKLSVKIPKHASPLRYPGGKSRMIDFIYSQLNPKHIKKFVSPFVGGGSVEFGLLEAGLVKELIINDKDSALIALYQEAFSRQNKLPSVISHIVLSKEFVKQTKDSVLSGNYTGVSRIDLATAYLVNNRTSFSGIYNAGLNKRLDSRFNQKRIANRIAKLNHYSSNVTVLNEEAIDIVQDNIDAIGTTLYMDPPYINKADKLYQYSFSDGEHYDLIQFLRDTHYSQPTADLMLFYDEDDAVKKFDGGCGGIRMDYQIIPRVFSIANGTQ